MVATPTQDGEWTHLNNLEVLGNVQVDTNLVVGGSVTAGSVAGVTPNATGASLILTAANAGSVTKLDRAAGSTAKLPAATGTGNVFEFVVTVSATSNSHKILANSSSDNIIGEAIGQNAGTCKGFGALTSQTYHSIQMPFAGTQPSGGIQGDHFRFIDLGANLWYCEGLFTAGTTPTTPFSTATT